MVNGSASSLDSKDVDEKFTADETELSTGGFSYNYTGSGFGEGYYQGKGEQENYINWRQKKLNTNGFTIISRGVTPSLC